jgi:AraC-like DNA-binding protein
MKLIFEEERPATSTFIERIWHTQSEQAGHFTSTAASQWEMVLMRYQGKTTLTIRGPETKASPADFPEGAEWLGITFKLGTFMPHLPLKTVMDRRDLNLPEASSKSFWLHGGAWQFPDYENADTFVHRLVREELLVNDPVVDAVLQGEPQILSPRSIQYRFLQATGLTQKAIQQIERAHSAMTLLQQGKSILDTAYAVGYFDQSHLTNSLKRFIGQTPAQIARVSQLE